MRREGRPYNLSRLSDDHDGLRCVAVTGQFPLAIVSRRARPRLEPSRLRSGRCEAGTRDQLFRRLSPERAAASISRR